MKIQDKLLFNYADFLYISAFSTSNSMNHFSSKSLDGIFLIFLYSLVLEKSWSNLNSSLSKFNFQSWLKNLLGNFHVLAYSLVFVKLFKYWNIIGGIAIAHGTSFILPLTKVVFLQKKENRSRNIQRGITKGSGRACAI